MDNCIFCKIANKEIESNIIYENAYVVAFPDLNPAAKVHVLVVPKVHVDNIYQLASHEDRAKIMDSVTEAIARVAEIYNTEEGFRVIVNNGEKAGQSVFHLHFHILGGQELPVSIL